MIVHPSDEDYPTWVCSECGLEASRNMGNRPLAFTRSTFHPGICGVCGKEKSVTEPRDFWYPNFYISSNMEL